MSKGKILVFIIILIAVSCFFLFDLGHYFTLDFFKTEQAKIDFYYIEHPNQAILFYFVIYVAVAALSLPGAALMTLVGGAIFGVTTGTLIVSFASTIGATLAFLASRFLFKDIVQNRFGEHLTAINAGIEKEGVFYLFTLRLVPAFPFFVINLVMGLTPIKTFTFYLVSQVGMLAGTIVYVNAGTQIAKIESLSGILSAKLIVSFAILGIFPLLAKKMVAVIQARKVYQTYKKPKQFDYNIVVIGAGSAGLVTSYIAAAVKAKVALVEKHRMGGDCLNTGCVPSKALLRTAKFLSHAKRAEKLGIKSVTVDFDFAQVMERVQRVIKQIEPHDSIERYSQLGVECITGDATITSPYTVEVNGQILTTRNIVIATGAKPFIPAIEGIENINYLSSDTIWDLREKPERLLVLGGGPIGCELAQAFSRLGSQVIIVQKAAQLLVREDPEVSQRVMDRFMFEGIDLRVEHKAVRFIKENNKRILVCERLGNHQGEEIHIEFDQLLIAVGRVANTQGIGLENLNIPLKPEKTIETNQYLQTIFPNIYACGDVVGPYQFTHAAAHQAWYASVNALFGKFKKFKVDYSVIPWATFTDPEVARVGLSELEAKEKGIAYEVTTYDIEELDRAIADEEAHGLIKVLTVPGKDRILGVTIVGEHAGDLIAEYVSAMRNGFGLNKILGTIHIYPTLVEANKYAAGNWKKAHAPGGLLKWVERYHQWWR